MTTSTISNLPVDLLIQILCRVPVNSMRAVRLTCKRWDTISKSGIFRKMHMRNEAAREEGESQMVSIMGFNLHLISVVVADADNPSTEIKGKLTRLSLDDDDSEDEVEIIKVFHCDGLLLCVLKDSFKLVVWNPYLGQTRWIEPPSYSYRAPDGRDRYRYALGYDSNQKSHKILRFLDGFMFTVNPSYFLRYEIYDFDSNSWRTLRVGNPYWCIPFYETGVPLNGNTYWLGRHRNSDHDESDRLICFDFTSETFGPVLPLPYPSEEGQDREVEAVLSCLKGEQLTLLLQFQRPWELEVWVTTMIDPNNVSWTNFFKVDNRQEIYFSKNAGGLFIDEKKKVAIGFRQVHEFRHTLNIIGEAEYFRQVDVHLPIERVYRQPQPHPNVCSYVPSLVQVQIKKPPSRAFKRKQLSKLEGNKPKLDEGDDSGKKRRRT